MAYTNINKSSDYFNTVLYTGNSTDNRTVTGVGFQPDWTWIKLRNAVSQHELFDAVRGANKPISSNLTTAESTTTNNLKSFDSDGFTLGTATAVNGNYNFVSWNWKANGAGSANTDGTISSTVSANTTSGFSIVTYTGTGSNATIGHGLNSAPSVVICKQLNATQQWINYHKAIGATKYLHLNATDASATSSTVWNDTDPTSSVFSVGTAVNCNGSGNTYVAYCFADVQGFSKVSGSYIGNGSTDGTFVYTGFKPAFVLLKNTTLSVENWVINDSGRNPSNIVTKDLFANQNYVEAVHSRQDFLSNGFKFRSTANNSNKSGDTYIYMAFAEAPLVGSNNVPATAR